jgi:uncharacterized protein YecE (DUF72 family)
MPEGPSIVILKEEVQAFTGQKIISVAGNSKIDQPRLLKQTVVSFMLFQLPPSFAYNPDKLALIINALNFDFKNVIEFRNASWWIQEVFDAFIKNKLIFCSVSYPGLPTTIIATTSTGYVRFHGDPKLFYSEYSEAELSRMCEEIEHAKKLKTVFIYFNNTASTAGILNALAIKNRDPSA